MKLVLEKFSVGMDHDTIHGLINEIKDKASYITEIHASIDLELNTIVVDIKKATDIFTVMDYATQVIEIIEEGVL